MVLCDGVNVEGVGYRVQGSCVRVCACGRYLGGRD